MHIQYLKLLSKTMESIASILWKKKQKIRESSIVTIKAQGEPELFAYSVHVISTSTYPPLNKGILISCIIPITNSYKLHLKLILRD